MVVDLRKLASHRLMDRAGARYCVQMLGAGWTEVVALVAAYVIAAAATPAGISGAVLLLPDALIRRLAGVLVIAIGIRCLWAGLAR
jgi:hypothetical protein